MHLYSSPTEIVDAREKEHLSLAFTWSAHLPQQHRSPRPPTSSPKGGQLILRNFMDPHVPPHLLLPAGFALCTQKGSTSNELCFFLYTRSSMHIDPWTQWIISRNMTLFIRAQLICRLLDLCSTWYTFFTQKKVYIRHRWYMNLDSQLKFNLLGCLFVITDCSSA